MKKGLTIALVAALALTLAVVPAAVAKGKKKPFAGNFKGETMNGSPISLQVTKNGQTKNIDGVLGVFCSSLQTPQTRAGVDLFKPPAGPKLGKTVQNSALQPSAMVGRDVTKTYTITVRRAGKRSVSGNLELSFSYFVPSLYGDWKIFQCNGSTPFSASRG
jgi:hypothetical protein